MKDFGALENLRDRSDISELRKVVDRICASAAECPGVSVNASSVKRNRMHAVTNVQSTESKLISMAAGPKQN